MGSIVCNPTKSECNQSEERNIQVLQFDNIQFAKRTDNIQFAKRTDYILCEITYQSFGLDKNKALRDEVLYFLSFVSEKELGENRGILITIVIQLTFL